MPEPSSPGERTTDPDGTQRVNGQVAETFDPDTTYLLPERITLDPETAGALAIGDLLPEMLAEGPDGATAVDVRRLSRAVLAAVEDMPRIPAWEGARATGGTGRPPAGADPLFTVDVSGGAVVLRVEMTCEHDTECADDAGIPPADARQWALALLAACGQAEANGPYITPDPAILSGATIVQEERA